MEKVRRDIQGFTMVVVRLLDTGPAPLEHIEMSFSRCASVPVGLSRFTPISGLRKSSFVCVYRGLYLALYDRKQATQIAQHEFHTKFVMVPFVITSQAAADAVDHFVPSSLADIYNFDKLANEIILEPARAPGGGRPRKL